MPFEAKIDLLNVYRTDFVPNFSSAGMTAQNSPELHFHFINSFIQPSRVKSLAWTIRCLVNETIDPET